MCKLNQNPTLLFYFFSLLPRNCRQRMCDVTKGTDQCLFLILTKMLFFLALFSKIKLFGTMS